MILKYESDLERDRAESHKYSELWVGLSGKKDLIEAARFLKTKEFNKEQRRFILKQEDVQSEVWTYCTLKGIRSYHKGFLKYLEGRGFNRGQARELYQLYKSDYSPARFKSPSLIEMIAGGLVLSPLLAGVATTFIAPIIGSASAVINWNPSHASEGMKFGGIGLGVSCAYVGFAAFLTYLADDGGDSYDVAA